MCGSSSLPYTTAQLSRDLVLTMLTLWVRPTLEQHSLITVLQVGLILTLHSPRVLSDEDTNHLTHSQQERRGRILDNLIDFSTAVVDEETGLKCVRTEESLETVEREKLLSCTHSSINICHYTYVTQFKSSRQEVCEDVYTKNCNIVFTKEARNETLEHCYYPLVMECDKTGQQTCRQFWESSCLTRYQSESDSHPVTECQKIPVELCGAQTCTPNPGERTCHSKVVTRVDETPEESCDIVPSKICRGVTQLVPHLTPVEKCSDLPRQICSFGHLSPRVSEKPLVTKWCFDPSEEEEEKEEEEEEEEAYDDNPPDLTPFEVEDVLVFKDDPDAKTNEDIRAGKDIDVSEDVTNYIDDDGGDTDLISSPLDPHRESQTEFQGKTRRTDDPLRNKPTNTDQTDIFEKSRNNDSIENITKDFEDEDNADEGQELDEEISAILTKLNSDFRSKISVEKADGTDDNEERRMTAVAKIIKHKSTPGRHTILIKNTSEARKLFGIKSGPGLGNNGDAVQQNGEIGSTNSLINDLETKNVNTPDLAFSEDQQVDNERGDLNTNIIELENHLKLQTREESGINSVDNPSTTVYTEAGPPGSSSHVC